jgi:hypothetical protein
LVEFYFDYSNGLVEFCLVGLILIGSASALKVV